jgi:uncharacterized protein
MKIRVSIRFYEELNDPLPPRNRKTETALRVDAGKTVKQVIESCNVPLSSVDLILVNGGSVSPSHIVLDGDRISVYPMFERMDIASVSRVRKTPLRNLKFICDAPLDKLARYLRLLGFDTLHENDDHTGRIHEIADKQKRVILTRNEKLLEDKRVNRGFLVRPADPWLQAKAVVSGLDLKSRIAPLSRCLKCNSRMRAVGKDNLREKTNANLPGHDGGFLECLSCKKVYRRGPGHESLVKKIRHMLSDEKNGFGVNGDGAEGETRTPTSVRPLDPEPSASTSSATSARLQKQG